MRTERARTVREALGRAAAVAKGALWISSETCPESGRERRTATSAPPAETFNAVAHSRKSFPFSSRLRTNTGIASGRRIQLLRSVFGFRRFKPAPWRRTYTPKSRTWGAKPRMGRGRLHVKDRQMGNLSVKTTVIQQQLSRTIFAFCSCIGGGCFPPCLFFNCQPFFFRVHFLSF